MSEGEGKYTEGGDEYSEGEYTKGKSLLCLLILTVYGVNTLKVGMSTVRVRRVRVSTGRGRRMTG